MPDVACTAVAARLQHHPCWSALVDGQVDGLDGVAHTWLPGATLGPTAAAV
jgi:hypothetical protein